MRRDFVRRLSAITASLPMESEECTKAVAILRYNANKQRFQASLDRMVAEAKLNEKTIIKKWSWKDAKISDKLRKKLKV